VKIQIEMSKSNILCLLVPCMLILSLCLVFTNCTNQINSSI